MNKTLLSAALVATLGALAVVPAAYAAQNSTPDGTIQIIGLVAANTCTVNANGSGSTAGTVNLPTVYASNFSGAGSSTGKTGFNIAVSGCDNNLSTVTTYWSGSNINSTDGNLKNTATSGSNAEVRLRNSDNSAIVLGGTTPASQNSEVVNLNNGAATLNYSAEYYATAATTTTGKVGTSVSFTMVYQ